MKYAYKRNQIVYYVQPINHIRPATVLNTVGNYCTIRFHDTGGGMRVRSTKLYPSEALAKEHFTNSKKTNEPDSDSNQRISGYKEYW